MNDEPKGREQEAALIGAVLRRPGIFSEVREIVKPAQFDYIPYRQAWEAMTTLAANEQGIDTLTVGDELDRRDLLKDWAPHESNLFIGRLGLSRMRETGQPQNARDYAANVSDYAAKREISAVMSQGAYWAANGRKASDILTDLEKKLAAINPGATASRSTVTLTEAIRKASNHTDRAARGEIQYIETGFIDLDKMITGFMAPDLIILAGLPSSGKTALLASLSQNIMEQGKRIAFFTLEMASEQVGMRFISMFSGVPYQTQLTGKLSFDEWNAYNAAIEKMETGNYGLFLNDLPAITPNRIRQELRRLWPIDLVVIDYLQLAGPDGRYESRHLEVASVTRALKAIGKEFNIPVLVAAQLSRAGTARASDDKRPILTDLGESSEIEKAADTVMFIHRPDSFDNVAEIIIPKQRNGPTGICNLLYTGSKTRFETVTMRHITL